MSLDDDDPTLRITYLLDRMEEEFPTNTRTELADYAIVGLPRSSTTPVVAFA